MDARTIEAYDKDAGSYAADWEDQQPAPADLYKLLSEYFSPGMTADVGCGSGRDTAWLAGNGFDAIGFDASEGLLAEARRRHPGIPFQQVALPALEGIAEGSFTNVLCETVLMHLAPATIEAAVGRLISILEPGGTLYLSWRVTPDTGTRDQAGRLYAAFDATKVTSALSSATILHETETSSTSSGRIVHRIVARKLASH